LLRSLDKHPSLAKTAISLLALTFIVAFSRTPAAAQQAGGERRIWDGVFTAEQAARGKAPFDLRCSRCHNVALAGSERGPALKGNAFVAKWETDTLASLYVLLRDSMPQDGAGLVADEIKIDILAYILAANGFPTGREELQLDVATLENIRFGKKGTYDGVYTAAQAERGKSAFLTGRCGGCHQLDLSGDRGPTLKGSEFLSHWESGSLNNLYTKIKETMPPNSPNESTDEAKLDIVAYLLQSNGFPPGSTELKADALESIELAQKGARAGAPNFALVQVVGCLAPGTNNTWLLTKTSEPVVTREDAPRPAALKDAQTRPLGTTTLTLVSVAPAFSASVHVGHKMEARGLLYRDRATNDNRLNLTSLQLVGASCQE
jgi:mono/diheme cytochrome c family protein